MDTITVGFSKPKNKTFPIFSWLIRLVDWAPYSHSYIRFYSSKFDRWLVYEASGTTVHFVEYSRWQGHATPVYEYCVPCSDETRTKVITKAIDLANAPYGIKQVAGIAIVKAARLIGKDVKNPFADEQATWVCSEIVAELLKEMGMDTGIKQDNVTPKDIQLFLEAQKLSGKLTSSPNG